MLTIELRFLSGRFHATPWGRHVNEGVPEWPPSPYRLLRAIYDAWKRKRPDWGADRIGPLLRLLATEPPHFHLPPARASHTRSYLSQNTTEPEAKSLIFDAFVILAPEKPVVIGWPSIDLGTERLSDLYELLSLVNYFGRSESWVSARAILKPSEENWNCSPAVARLVDNSFDIIRVACAISADRYERKPYVKDAPSKTKRAKKSATTSVSAGPLSWLDAMAFSTDDMLTARLSEPPALHYVNYLRPARCFDRPAAIRRPAKLPTVNGVLYALECKVPPLVTATLEIAEQVRRRLMGIHRRLMDGDPRKVSPKFSGKDAAGRPLCGHRHAFILPQDSDSDGWLDHLLVVCTDNLDLSERRALDLLDRLYQRGGKPDIRCIPVRWGTLRDLQEPVGRVTSATPFVPPRHYRKGRGDFAEWLFAEVRREAANHSLPEISYIKPVPRLVSQGRSFSWLDFRRNRKDDAVTLGYGFELEFAQPVLPAHGPLALGYASHFGLGQFRPA